MGKRLHLMLPNGVRNAVFFLTLLAWGIWKKPDDAYIFDITFALRSLCESSSNNGMWNVWLFPN